MLLKALVKNSKGLRSVVLKSAVVTLTGSNMSANSNKDNKPKADIGLVEFVALMALMTSLVALSIDAVLPALSQIGADLQIIDPKQNHLIVSLFFYWYGFWSALLWSSV